ncbi:MAG TPA: hypothetical protein VFP65_27800, partial [Anaeromyxobacteraceae bacterium]|nr:hypothetical protein [Anaeromyxobacteraceae bacterium]
MASRPLLALRPVAAVHRLPPRSEACPLSLTDLLRLLEGGPGGPLPVVATPFAGVARAALLAAKDARAVVGLACVAIGVSPDAWFDAVCRAADELAPGLPFFLSADVRVEAGAGGVARAVARGQALVEAGVGHLAVDVSALALPHRAEAAARVAGFAAEREIAVECVLPGDGAAPDPDDAAAFVEEFEGWGVRADVVGARLAAAGDGAEARRQALALALLARAIPGRWLARRGPLSPALAETLRRHPALRLCDDGAAAVAAGRRALP